MRLCKNLRLVENRPAAPTRYFETYGRSLERPEEFWAEAAEAIDWERRCLGDHRHVNQHPVALDHAEAGKDAGKTRDLVTQLAVREPHDLAADRAVPDQCSAFTPSRPDMTVERIPASVEFGTREPAIKRRAAVF